MEFGDLLPKLNTIIGDLKAIRRNTDDSACCDAITVGSSGSTSVPEGLGSVSIVQTSAGTVTIQLTEGNFVMDTQGEVFTDVAGDGKKLPAYTITGTASWKWHGIK